MLDHLRRKEGGDTIPVTVGDMTTARADGPFRLVYLVYNTIMNVTTQAGQVAVFRNAATHLEPGGAFVIEVGVPDLQGSRSARPSGLRLQRAALRHRRVRRGQPGPGLAPLRRPRRRDLPLVGAVPLRLALELDLMADMAGLRLRERWSGWQREPFTNMSEKHVSVWEKASVSAATE